MFTFVFLKLSPDTIAFFLIHHYCTDNNTYPKNKALKTNKAYFGLMVPSMDSRFHKLSPEVHIN